MACSCRCCAPPLPTCLSPHAAAQGACDALAHASGSDGALSWEVPPALEPDYGAATAPAAAAAAADPAAGGGGASGGGAAASAGSGAAELGAPLMGALSARVHPLVVRARRELAAAAHSHLCALIKQLLRAEAVGAWRKWAPVVERLALEAAATVSPGAAAQHGELDPRYYVKVRAPALWCGGCSGAQRGERARPLTGRRHRAPRVPPARGSQPRITCPPRLGCAGQARAGQRGA
jgi:hypothetical protein